MKSGRTRRQSGMWAQTDPAILLLKHTGSTRKKQCALKAHIAGYEQGIISPMSSPGAPSFARNSVMPEMQRALLRYRTEDRLCHAL